MRILQVIRVFSASFGGPVTVVRSISKELARNVRSTFTKKGTIEGISLTMIKQALYSLFRVSCVHFRSNLQYKMITLFNVVKKGIIPNILDFTPSLTKYRFNDCILTVKFKNLTFNFLCPKGKMFHIYMNPYFHEYDVSSFVCDTLEEGDVFIDIGAMGGLYSVISSTIVGNKGKVISVEPNPDNYCFLQKNIALNSLDNIILVRKAVGEKNSKVTLYYDKESTELTSAFKGKSKESFETEMVTLDSLMEKEPVVKILKVDTEGYDEKVLEGARKTLQKTHYCIVETNDEIIRKLFRQLGFNCTTMHPSGYLLAKRTIRAGPVYKPKT